VRHAAEFQFSRRPDVPAFLPAVRSVSSDVFPASVLTAQGTPENTGVTPTVGREVRTSVSGGDVGAALQAAAIAVAIQYETGQGRQVKYANGAQQGFDLVSRRPHPYDPQTCVDVRFISVKGYRDTTGLIITLEEMSLAEQLQDDYWVYGVMDCDTSPRVLALQNPHRQVLRPVTDIRHYVFDETGRGN
jgi:hypothetical protein